MQNSRSSSTTTHHQNVNEFEFSKREQKTSSSQQLLLAQQSVASKINHRRGGSTSTSLSTPQNRLNKHQHGLFSSESDISSVLQLQLRNKLNRNRNYAYVRRKLQWNYFNTSTTTMLLLMLTCLVVKMEIVIGALSINYNSVNYYDNSTTITFSDESDLVPFLNDVDNSILTNRSPSSISSRPPVIYHNEFALYIPSGLSKANEIASKYGFVNMGQVRIYIHYYYEKFPPNFTIYQKVKFLSYHFDINTNDVKFPFLLFPSSSGVR